MVEPGLEPDFAELEVMQLRHRIERSALDEALERESLLREREVDRDADDGSVEQGQEAPVSTPLTPHHYDHAASGAGKGGPHADQTSPATVLAAGDALLLVGRGSFPGAHEHADEAVRAMEHDLLRARMVLAGGLLGRLAMSKQDLGAPPSANGRLSNQACATRPV